MQRIPDEQLLDHYEDPSAALAELFSRHADRLGRMVRCRMDRRLTSRVDADDVLQEAYLAGEKRLSSYRNERSNSFFIWLRLIVEQTLIDVHRRHLGTKMRDAGREVGLHGRKRVSASSASLTIQLMGSMTPPSQAAQRAEATEQLSRALEDMSETDREVLTLRHFEELSNSEVAELLDISAKSASIRYVRALERLRSVMSDLGDDSTTGLVPDQPDRNAANG